MKRFIACLLALLLACTACTAPPASAPETRVLFVGNSLVYVGNAPAVYAALATANGHPTRADMIVRGGATLTQRLEDGSVARALESGGYALLVLQERGGDAVCGFGPGSCEQSRQAIIELAALARAKGTRAVLLGTYQPGAAFSPRLVAAEADLARAAGIDYVEVSETFARLRSEHPEQDWFDADGMHPGRDLALLNAVQLYRVVHGGPPVPAALEVPAPIFAPRSGLEETLRAADDPPPLPDTPLRGQYPRDTVEALLGQ